MPGHISSLENALILLDIDYDIEPEYEQIELNLRELDLTDTPMRLTFSVYRKLRFQIYFKKYTKLACALKKLSNIKVRQP